MLCTHTQGNAHTQNKKWREGAHTQTKKHKVALTHKTKKWRVAHMSRWTASEGVVH